MRADRALLNVERLARLRLVLKCVGYRDAEGVGVFVTRLFIALNTAATALDEIAAADVSEEAGGHLRQLAELLWSIPERAAIIDPHLQTFDCGRRSQLR